MKKRLSTILILILIITITNAQTINIGQVAKTVYVNQKMPIIFNLSCPAETPLKYQVTNGKIEKQGDNI